MNTLAAFARGFRAGFGAEIDVRDSLGRLVVAHDVPEAGAASLDLEEVLRSHAELAADACLALNIKADGLQPLLGALLRRYEVRDYFAFDMSVPDMLGYAAAGLQFFTRHSDVEDPPVLLNEAAGVWVDGFHADWARENVLAAHAAAGKRLALVSPELHRRDHVPFWGVLRSMRRLPPDALLCTDHPIAAQEFFHG
jgi:hypothetical protein